MDAGLCVKTVVFLLHFQQYCAWRLPYKKYYDCDTPWINYTDDVQPYTEIGGFQHREMLMVYDKRNKRTEFISVVMDEYNLRQEPTMCAVNMTGMDFTPPDVPALLVPDMLGGTCDLYNVFPLNINCTVGRWTLLESLVRQAVESNNAVKFCTQLVYAKDGDRRPSEIIARYYTFPNNKYIDSIAINNPIRGECQEIRHRVN